MAHDSIGREWQVATIQLDFVQPERFGLTCMNEKSEREGIVMFHVAIMGSIERFMAILIEHYAGSFPTWLNPLQVAIIPVRENHSGKAAELAKLFTENDIRVEIIDDGNSLGKRIHAAKAQRAPYTIVLGDKEIEAGTLTIEKRDGSKLEGVSKEDFIKTITEEIKNRS
jgi:threonyl-tRNA synthetase